MDRITKTIISFTLMMIMIINPIYANANTAIWEQTSIIRDGATSKYIGKQVTNQGVYQGIATVTPTVSQVAKQITKTGAVMAVELAIKQLLDVVDWVMDPANNQVRYTIPVNQVKDTEAIAYCKKLAQERGRTYGSLRVNKGENYIYFDCMNPYLNQYGSYSPNRERVISNNVIAQQIIANANKKSELYSQVYVGEVADDNITTAEKEKLWEKTKKKVDEPEHKTCNQIDPNMPKCIFLNGFKYSTKRQAIEQRGLTGLRAEKSVNYNRFCGNYGTHEKYFPNKNIQTARGNYGASLCSCQCCQETLKGGKVMIKWRVD